MAELICSSEWSYHNVNIAPQQRASSDGHESILERIEYKIIVLFMGLEPRTFCYSDRFATN